MIGSSKGDLKQRDPTRTEREIHFPYQWYESIIPSTSTVEDLCRDWSLLNAHQAGESILFLLDAYG
jgi:hypothetical protein